MDSTFGPQAQRLRAPSLTHTHTFITPSSTCSCSARASRAAAARAASSSACACACDALHRRQATSTSTEGSIWAADFRVVVHPVSFGVKGGHTLPPQARLVARTHIQHEAPPQSRLAPACHAALHCTALYLGRHACAARSLMLLPQLARLLLCTHAMHACQAASASGSMLTCAAAACLVPHTCDKSAPTRKLVLVQAAPEAAHTVTGWQACAT